MQNVSETWHRPRIVALCLLIQKLDTHQDLVGVWGPLLQGSEPTQTNGIRGGLAAFLSVRLSTQGGENCLSAPAPGVLQLSRE